MIQLRSIFDPATDQDGFRVLVDPVWPEKAGRSKTVLNVWLRGLAPEGGLSCLYAGGSIGEREFARQYHAQLQRKEDLLDALREHAGNGGLTLVHGRSEYSRATAAALMRYLEAGGAEEGKAASAHG